MTPSKKYTQIWKRFASELRGVYENLAEIPETTTLHEQMKEMYGVPYEEIRPALKKPEVDDTSENIGSITGLFFEQVATALIVPKIRQHVPGARIARNTCPEKSLHSVTRDPDLYVTNNKKRLIVEFKASPKKGEFENVLWAHEKLSTQGVGYYFLGGYATAKPELFRKLNTDSKWACILEASDRNSEVIKELPALDEIVKEMIEFLKGS